MVKYVKAWRLCDTRDCAHSDIRHCSIEKLSTSGFNCRLNPDWNGYLITAPDGREYNLISSIDGNYYLCRGQSQKIIVNDTFAGVEEAKRYILDNLM